MKLSEGFVRVGGVVLLAALYTAVIDWVLGDMWPRDAALDALGILALGECCLGIVLMLLSGLCELAERRATKEGKPDV